MDRGWVQQSESSIGLTAACVYTSLLFVFINPRLFWELHLLLRLHKEELSSTK